MIDSPGRYVLVADIRERRGGVCIHVLSSGVVFDGDGHTIRGPGGSGVAIRVDDTERPGDELEDVAVRNAEVRGWKSGLVVVSEVDGLELRGITAVDNGAGIHLFEVTDLTASELVVETNGDTGLSLDNVFDGTFTDVRVTRNGRRGLYLTTDANDNVFSDLYVANNDGPGVVIDENSRNTFRDSTIESNRGPGVRATDHEGSLVRVTLRDNGGPELSQGEDGTLDATALRVGRDATLSFDDGSVSVDHVDRRRLPRSLPRAPVSEGFRLVNVDSRVSVTISYGPTVDDSSVALAHFDGRRWRQVRRVTVDRRANTITAPLFRDGLVVAVDRTRIRSLRIEPAVDVEHSAGPRSPAIR